MIRQKLPIALLVGLAGWHSYGCGAAPATSDDRPVVPREDRADEINDTGDIDGGVSIAEDDSSPPDQASAIRDEIPRDSKEKAPLDMIPDIYGKQAAPSRTPPARVGENEDGLDERFTAIEDLDRAPTFLSPGAMLRALPARARGDVREEMMYRLGPEGDGGVDLAGAFLDDGGRLMVLRHQYGALANVFMLVDSDGRLRDTLRFEERTAHGYVADIVGDETRELIIPVIEGFAMSTYPETWRIYQVRGGGLKEIARVDKSLSRGSKSLWYAFDHAVTFPEKGRMRVERVTGDGCDDMDPEDAIECDRRIGDVTEYEYKGGRFVKSRFIRGPFDPERLVPLEFDLALHRASDNPEAVDDRFSGELAVALDVFSEAAIAFDFTDGWNDLPKSLAVLDPKERAVLGSHAVKRRINLIVVDGIRPAPQNLKSKKTGGEPGQGRVALQVETPGRPPGRLIVISRYAPEGTVIRELARFFGLSLSEGWTGNAPLSKAQLETIYETARKLVKRRQLALSR